MAASIFISLQMLLAFTSIMHAAITVTCTTYHDSTPKIVLSSTNSSTKQNLRWVGPIGHRIITVDVNGGGHFRSVQDAVNAVPDNNRMNVLIQISAGYYIEKVVVPVTKPYITFQGGGRDVTVIEWHDRASDPGPNGQQLRTYRTASVTVFANYFSARNITFKNTAPAPMPGMQGWQAAAFRISGDKAYFSGCGFYGAQDTLCDDAGRHYFKECYIEGSIDFIFGNGRSMYKDCELHSIATRFGSIAAQDRKYPYEKTGFAFVRCKVTGTGPVYVGRAMGQYSRIVYAYTYFDDIVTHDGWDDWNNADNNNKKYPYEKTGFAFVRCKVTGTCPVYVGRAMGQYSRIVYAYTYFDDIVTHDGWDDWNNADNNNKTVFFGVYKCWGPGAATLRGVSLAQELDFELAHPFLVKSFVNGRHWIAPSDA